jgi:hypothetical protein
MADKSLLIGDEAADVLLEYAALLAQIGRGDSVRLRAIGADGDEVTVGFLLNSGTVLLIESSTSTLPEPENGDPVAYMTARLDSYKPEGGGPEGPWALFNQPQDDATKTAEA